MCIRDRLLVVFVAFDDDTSTGAAGLLDVLVRDDVLCLNVVAAVAAAVDVVERTFRFI